jgi:cell division protein FtsL
MVMKKTLPNIKQLIVFAALIVLFFLMMDFNNRLGDLSRLNNQLVRIETSVADSRTTESALSTKIIYSTSEAAVNEFARNHGMIQEGENLIVPLAEGTPQTQVDLPPEPTPQPVENPDVWWALFFGE